MKNLILLFLLLIGVVHCATVSPDYLFQKRKICTELTPGEDRLAKFPLGEFGTTAIPFVPIYPMGTKQGPRVYLNGFSPVDTFSSNPYAPDPMPNVTDTSTYAPAVIGQVRQVEVLSKAEFGAASLNRTSDLIHLNVLGINIPDLPELYPLMITETGKYMSQIEIPPTLTTAAIGPTNSPFNGFFVLNVPQAHDTALSKMLEKKYNCNMPRTAVKSTLCPVINGFSQARVDWNLFRTSTITALNTNGTSLESQFQQIVNCITDLLSGPGLTYKDVIRVRVSMTSQVNDLASENQFRALWKASPFVSAQWKPARNLEKNVLLLDPNALIGIAIEEAFAGSPDEYLRSYNDELVFSLPDEYSLVVMTPAGFAYTSQIASTTNNAGTPITFNSDGRPFYGAVERLDPTLRGFLNAFIPVYGDKIYANWIAQQVQVFINAAIVLGKANMDISDIIYQFNRVGCKGDLLEYFAISDAVAYIYNRTQGNSNFVLPERDDLLSVDIPYYLGGKTLIEGGSFAVTHTASFIGVDRFNLKRLRARNNGAAPGVTSFVMCDGSTDISTCPMNLVKDHGAVSESSTF